MKIAIDCRMKHGVATVVRNIMPHLVSQGHQVYAMGNSQRFNEWWPNNRDIRYVEFKAPVYGLREQLDFPLGDIRDCDILHVPHFNVPVRRLPFPLLATINDLAHLAGVMPMTWLHKQSARMYLKHAAWRADHITTLSAFSHKEIVEKLRVDPTNITVIPCAVNHQEFQPVDKSRIHEVTERMHIGQPYLMIAGSVRPHKNVGRVLRAFSELKQRHHIPHQLVVAGEREGFRIRNELPSIPEEVQRSIVFTGYIDDDDLTALYSGTEVFIFASLYEGFGLPPLEAMACGAPVAVSRAASIPEVVGNAGIYFDPFSVDEMTTALLSLIENPERRLQAKAASLQRAREFSWSTIAQQYLHVYERLVSGRT